MTDIYRNLIQNINYTLLEHGTLGIKCPPGSGIVNKTIQHINSKKISCALIMPATVDMVDLADISDKLLKTSKGKDLVLIFEDLACGSNMLQHFANMVINRSFNGTNLNIQASFVVAHEPCPLYDAIAKAGLRNFGEYDATNDINQLRIKRPIFTKEDLLGLPRMHIQPKSIGGNTGTP